MTDARSTLSRRTATLSLTAILVACGSSHQATTLGDQQSARLDPGRAILITVPPDGRYGETVYAGSGEAAARALQRALLVRGGQVEVGSAAASQYAALAAARSAQAAYLIFPVITHWEDRATEWSGLPDRIEVVVSVIDVPAGRLIMRSALTGRSSWWTLGGDKPQDLLTTPATAFAASLL
jgi:hypothetical protein